MAVLLQQFPRGPIVPLSWLFLLAVALLPGLLPSAGQAQTRNNSGAEPAGYREAIDSALEEMQLGNFVEAREQFSRAHGLFPNARTLRGLGISEFELKHYAIAVDQLSAALASDVRPLDSKLRGETEALLKRANTYVGELHITVSPNSATLTIDGTRKIARLDAPVRLDVGDHVLEFRAKDYAPERRQVSVRGGQADSLELQLSSLSAASAESQPGPINSPAQEAHSETTPVYKRWWLWTIVGVVVAGAAVGTALALHAHNQQPEYHSVPSVNTPDGVALQPLWSH
jgi:tetratricopeptide (TPR) repeat protein